MRIAPSSSRLNLHCKQIARDDRLGVVVQIGKQLPMTRGAITTFSIANDVVTYFAIITAMFAGVFPA